MYKLRHLLIIGICTLVLIVACDRGAYLEGNRPPDSELTSDKPTLVSSESCRLVQHSMGETEVCETARCAGSPRWRDCRGRGQPQRVAALSPHILDSILALGVQPTAYAESEDLKIQTYDSPAEQIPYIGKWVTTQPIGLGDRKSPSLERLALVKPDLTTYVASQPESTTGRLLKEIGFEIVQPRGIQGDAEISWEILPQIETDMIIVLSWSDDSFYNPENIMQEKWANNPLLKSMSVFQQGRVYFVDYQLWGSNIRGPLADRLILEALPDLLLDSVE